MTTRSDEEEAVVVEDPSYLRLSGTPNASEDKEAKKKIVSAIVKVFQTLKQGRRESVYQNALKYELSRQFQTACMIEFPLPIIYEQERVGVSYIDLLLPRKFFVEVKSTAKLSIKDKLQTMAYSRDLNLKGILVNFVNRSEESVEILVVNGHSIVERLA